MAAFQTDHGGTTAEITWNIHIYSGVSRGGACSTGRSEQKKQQTANTAWNAFPGDQNKHSKYRRVKERTHKSLFPAAETVPHAEPFRARRRNISIHTEAGILAEGGAAWQSKKGRGRGGGGVEARKLLSYQAECGDIHSMVVRG